MKRGNVGFWAWGVGACAMAVGTMASIGCGVGGDDLFSDAGGSGGRGGATAGPVTSTTSSSSASTTTTTTSMTASTTSTSTSTSSGGGGSSSSTDTGSASGGGGASTTTTASGGSGPGGGGAGGSATICGDGVKQQDEACDGADLGGQTCTSLGFVNPGGLACAGDCQSLVTTGCHAACNGTLEPGETCDGANLGGHTCVDLGYVAPGGLQCKNCALDGTGCTAVCGNGTTEPGEECDDGGHDPGDGCSPNCKIEPTGVRCNNAIPIALTLGTQTFTGNTTGGGVHEATDCQSNGADRVYAVTAASSGFLTASLTRSATTFDAVLYVSSTCSEGADIADTLCADSYDANTNQPLNGGEMLSIPVQQGETVFLFVDGFESTDGGSYQLVVDLSTGTDCTDPVPIPLSPGSAMTVLGSNVGNGPSQQGSCGGSPGDEIVYQVTRIGAGPLQVDTDLMYTDYNAVLYARSSCNSAATELDCSNQQGNGAESIAVNLTSGTPSTFVWIDGSQIGGGVETGDYGLTLTP